MEDQVIENIISKVLEFLQTMVSPVVQQGFEIAVKRSFAIGILWNIETIFFIILAIVTITYSLKVARLEDARKKEDRYAKNPNENEEFVKLAFLWVLSIVFLAVTIVGFGNNLRTFAPEWYAIMDIISLVK